MSAKSRFGEPPIEDQGPCQWKPWKRGLPEGAGSAEAAKQRGPARPPLPGNAEKKTHGAFWLDQFGAGTLTPSTAKLLCAPEVPFCRGAGDCPIGTACNTTTGQCEGACGDASYSICHGGCCGDGTCQPGTVASACGSGGACAVCDATNQSGSACVITGTMSGHCGCTSEGDCPAASGQSGGQACLLAGIYICTTECNAPNVTRCNGGCCSAPPGPPPYGTCQPGTADAVCGNTGGTCVDCTSSLASCVNGTCAP